MLRGTLWKHTCVPPILFFAVFSLFVPLFPEQRLRFYLHNTRAHIIIHSTSVLYPVASLQARLILSQFMLRNMFFKRIFFYENILNSTEGTKERNRCASGLWDAHETSWLSFPAPRTSWNPHLRSSNLASPARKGESNGPVVLKTLWIFFRIFFCFKWEHKDYSRSKMVE